MSDLPIVLLTRPREQSLRFAKGLTGLKVVISPILKIEFRRTGPEPRDYDILVFTSENGVRAAAAFHDLAGMRGYAVGERTAAAGKEIGLDLKPAAGSADDLVSLIIEDRPTGRLLHLHGAHSRGNVAERLQNAGLDTDSTVCYDQIEQPLNAEAQDLLAGEAPVLLPLFSPRSAALLGQSCEKARAPISLIAISPAALEAWTGPEPISATAVSVPTADAVTREILLQMSRAT